ncbi:MAG: hypothetical protein HDQ96_03690 [Lachnospiraceae bacterium]|nr:hypothetical protein [Lachnospiraceae bacterium]
MLTFIVGMAILWGLLWLGFKMTGALLKACIWLFILVPLAIGIWGIALICCCTLILIPIGIRLFTAGMRVIIPV